MARKFLLAISDSVSLTKMPQLLLVLLGKRFAFVLILFYRQVLDIDDTLDGREDINKGMLRMMMMMIGNM